MDMRRRGRPPQSLAEMKLTSFVVKAIPGSMVGLVSASWGLTNPLVALALVFVAALFIAVFIEKIVPQLQSSQFSPVSVAVSVSLASVACGLAVAIPMLPSIAHTSFLGICVYGALGLLMGGIVRRALTGWHTALAAGPYHGGEPAKRLSVYLAIGGAIFLLCRLDSAPSAEPCFRAGSYLIFFGAGYFLEFRRRLLNKITEDASRAATKLDDLVSNGGFGEFTNAGKAIAAIARGDSMQAQRELIRLEELNLVEKLVLAHTYLESGRLNEAHSLVVTIAERPEIHDESARSQAVVFTMLAIIYNEQGELALRDRCLERAGESSPDCHFRDIYQVVRQAEDEVVGSDGMNRRLAVFNSAKERMLADPAPLSILAEKSSLDIGHDMKKTILSVTEPVNRSYLIDAEGYLRFKAGLIDEGFRYLFSCVSQDTHWALPWAHLAELHLFSADSERDADLRKELLRSAKYCATTAIAIAGETDHSALRISLRVIDQVDEKKLVPFVV